MCLILVAHRVHPDYPLVVAANRDEFYERPTAQAAFWEDAPHVLAGRDLTAGGTWLGVTRSGRWAALTNFRDPPTARPGRPSRGALVADFLRGEAKPEEYLDDVAARAQQYDGFNLLVGDPSAVHYFGNRTAIEDAQRTESRQPPRQGGSSRESAPHALDPGLYGLSNHLLDTAWPKVARGKRALQELVEAAAPTPEALLEILHDMEIAPVHALPQTGVGAEWERILSASFVVTPTYGTRASTVLLIDRTGNVTLVERSFLPGPVANGESRFQFPLEGP